MSASPAPVAGPSRPRRFFVDPFKVTDYQAPLVSFSRSGTPAYLPGRFRSVSLARTEREEDANEARLRNARHHSVLRLKSAWDLLLEKYGNVQPQDDDEVDLFTGRIVKDRGRLRGLQRLEFGDSLEDERADESFLGSEGPSEPAFDSDEDELGAWDDRSGLDLQMPGPEQDYVPPPRTLEDEEDLQAFLRAEADRRGTEEEEEESQRDNSDDEGRYAASSSASSRGWSPRSHGTRITVDLEGLAFDGESGGDSEDELLQRTSDAEEAVRTDPVDLGGDSDIDSVSTDADHPRRRRLQLEVVLPSRAKSTPARSLRNGDYPFFASSPLPLRERPANPTPDPLPALLGLFTPPPPEVHSTTITASSLPVEPDIRPLSTPPSVNKGKGRKSSERPNHHDWAKGSDPFRYHFQLLASSNGKGHRQCTACHDFGGQRARMACFCRGRARPILCTFFQHQDFGTPDSVDSAARQSGSIQRPNPPTLSFTPRRYSETPRHTSASIRDSPPNIAAIDLDLDPYYYLPTLVHEADGITPRSCSACQETTLERAQYAMYCKGRSFRGFCKFGQAEAVIPTPPQETTQVLSALDSPPMARGLAAIDRIVLEMASASRLSRGRSRSVISEYLDTIRQLPGAQVPMYCRPCRAAGDARAEKAIYCRGRTWTKLCPFVNRAILGGTFTGGTPIPTADAPSEDPLESPSLTGDEDTHSESLHNAERADVPAYLQRLRYSKNGAIQLVCKVCRAAGGVRWEKAGYCNGRQASEHCIFLERNRILRKAKPPVSSFDELDGTSVILHGVEETITVSMPRRAEGFPADARPPTPTPDDNTPQPVVLSSGGRAKRKRAIISPPISLLVAEGPIHEPETVSIDDLFKSPPPGSLHQNLRSSTIPSQSSLHIATRRTTDSLSATYLSMPPLSPPFMASSSVGEHESLPLVTADPVAPGDARSGKIRRYPLAEASAGFRIPPLAICPTPSPSLAGEQSSSPCSDHVALKVPPRKSALKQRSSDTSSPAYSSKRLRFSLQPQSPPPGLTNDVDLRFSGLGHTMSPASSMPDSSPTFRASLSSSPFSNEINVRAADVGFQLRPEHTGRISHHMLAALAPSLDGSRSPLGSSTSRSSAGYALPTPPLSFGSTTSTLSRSQAPESSPSRPMGLMLPPPVPVKRQTPVRPLTPVSPPKEEDEERPSSILMVTKSVAVIRAKSRARSRPVSVAPSSAPYSARGYEMSTPFGSGVQRHRQVSTTPSRRKSRSERELARVARDMGDDAGLEWGMDEEIGVDMGRLWREGSVVQYL